MAAAEAQHVHFFPHLSLKEWLETKDVGAWKEQWLRNGFVVVDGFLDEQNTKVYCALSERLLSGEIDCSSHRHDLGSHGTSGNDGGIKIEIN